jgi:hypothetical protein
LFKEVPCVAGFINDVVVVVEDGDREFVAAQIFPNVFTFETVRSVLAGGSPGKGMGRPNGRTPRHQTSF